MSEAAWQTRHMTYAEYLELSATSAEKLEYLGGVVYAMAGSTDAHALISANTCLALGVAMPDGPCFARSSDLRIRIDASDCGFYPDVSVICGEPRASPDDPLAATNPTALFEVSSPSTWHYDRTRKLKQYAQLESLRHYVIVSHQVQEVEVFSRGGPAEDWVYTSLGPDDDVVLAELPCAFPVARLYRGTTVPRASTDHPHLDLLAEALAAYGLTPAQS